MRLTRAFCGASMVDEPSGYSRHACIADVRWEVSERVQLTVNAEVTMRTRS